jgi:L-alanine-DL-glutamate epimerase-like enolase superfamily enzyme
MHTPLPQCPAPVDSIELFRVQVNKPRYFSFGAWHNRQHAWFKITSGEHTGWAEQIAARNTPDVDLSIWGAALCELEGQSVSGALEFLHSRREVWPTDLLEGADMALLDLMGRCLGVPSVELLNLPGREAVPGLFCILEETPEAAREQAELSLQHNLKTHCKIKIFGRNDLDCELVRTVREVFGPDAFLSADANGGYEFEGVDALAADLRRLHEAGLNACEDPAYMPNEAWVELQSKIGELGLIPDYPAKVAWRALETLQPGMGTIYNIHPANAGSLQEVVRLGRKIQGYGARLMIGDDSLVGPACTAWQQIGIGLGAAWVEALEKPEESDVLSHCTVQCSTEQKADGRFGLRELRPGFGLELDEAYLHAHSEVFRLL